MADYAKFFQNDYDLDSMNLLELVTYLDYLHMQIEELDGIEPSDMDSEEHEEWAECHEVIEDRIDELFDYLDEAKKDTNEKSYFKK